jgi:hypothetical protein
MVERIVGNATELNHLFPPSKSNKAHRAFWASPEVFASHVSAIKDRWHDSAWDRSDSEWHGTKTFEEAVNLARSGWKEGVNKIDRVSRFVSAMSPTAPRIVKYGVTGAYPNIARAIAGDPINMRLPDLVRSRRRSVITLISNMGCNWTIGSDCFINRAAAVASLVDQLETAGYACDVIAYTNSQGFGHKTFDSTVAVQVKNSNQPVDLPRLAFGLGHTAMFRRLVFAEWGGDNFCEDLGEGLGFTGKLVHSEEMRDRNIFIIPSAGEKPDYFKTEKATLNEGLPWIKERLAEQGFPGFKRKDE